MVCRVEGDDVCVFASKAGAPSNPDWFPNLVAIPSVVAELGSETLSPTAEVLDGAERDRVYADHARVHPGFAVYEAMTDLIIPVVRLVCS